MKTVLEPMLNDRFGYTFGPGGGCSECPFSEATPHEEPPNMGDPDEGYYDCSLIPKKRIWGESPACTEKQWRAKAVDELGRMRAVLRRLAEALRYDDRFDSENAALMDELHKLVEEANG